MNRKNLLLLVAFIATSLGPRAQADNFGSGLNSFSIDFVPIGNPNNVADTTGSPNPAGSVSYFYRMGKYEISEQMIDKANALGGLGITKDARGPDKPATSLSWFDAAKFVNWLNTSTGHAPAYKFNAGGVFQLWLPGDPGYNAGNLFRNSSAKYFLPSADEWYKAAFYDPAINGYWDFPTGSNDPPQAVASGVAPGTAVWNTGTGPAIGLADVTASGGLSPYGTMGQAGNAWEWEETEFDLVNDSPNAARGVRGGDWMPSLSPLNMASSFRSSLMVDGNPFSTTVRVASAVPEPSGVAMLGSVLVVLRAKRFQTA